MSHFDLSDSQGNQYRLSLGTRIPMNDNIAGHPAKADALLYQVDIQQLLRARQHFYGTGQFPILGAWQQERLGSSDAPLCPFETLVDALCHHELTLIKISTGDQEGGEDRRGILRVKIRQALAEIIAQEKIEAAGHARRLEQESGFGRAMIYTGAFFSGLWDAGVDLAKWVKEINDVVSPSQRLLRSVQAAFRANKRSEESGESFFAAMADEHLKGEKRELVEAIGFDPTSITAQQVDQAIEIADLIWDDPALRQDITRFAKDFANAQHAIEITNIAGGAAFEALFTIVLAAVTAGAGLAVGAAGQARHLRKFRKVGDLFVEFAEQAKKHRRKAAKSDSAKASKNDFGSLDADDVDVKTNLAPNNSAHAAVPEKVPMTQDEYDRIINLEQGNRPEDVTDYLPEEYVDAHLAKFEEEGGAFVVIEDWIANPEYTSFPKDGKFVGLSSEMDGVIEKYKASNNDWRVLRDELNLGDNVDLSGSRISYVKLSPHDERFGYQIPTGNERGAYEGEWVPGGFTKSGTSEAVLSGGDILIHNNNVDNLSKIEGISVEKLQ